MDVMYEKYCIVRDLHHVTDYQVAKATGINRSTFSDWKSGRSEPKREKLQKIAKYFGISTDYFFDDDAPMFQSEKHEGEAGKGAERESLFIQETEMIISRLNENSLRRLRAYVEKLYALQREEETLS